MKYDVNSDGDVCQECGEKITQPYWSNADSSDMVVCTDCWFDVLTGEEREELAEHIVGHSTL